MGSEVAYCCDTSSKSVPVLDNLKQRRSKIAEELQNVDNAIAALEQNPEIEKVLTLLAKTGRY